MCSLHRPTSFFHNELRDQLHITVVLPLVDDDQVRLHDPPDPVFRRLLHLRGFEKLDEVGDSLETDLVSFFHGRPSEGDGQVGFSDARRVSDIMLIYL